MILPTFLFRSGSTWPFHRINLDLITLIVVDEQTLLLTSTLRNYSAEEKMNYWSLRWSWEFSASLAVFTRRPGERLTNVVMKTKYSIAPIQNWTLNSQSLARIFIGSRVTYSGGESTSVSWLQENSNRDKNRSQKVWSSAVDIYLTYSLIQYLSH
jgi:hypothetical protein